MKLNTLSFLAALSLFTCPAINCALFSKLGSFSTRFVPKATILASGYKFFKPTVVRAEDKEFTQEEKQLVFKALCKKSDYDTEKLENGPISCHCFQQLQSAEAGFRAKIWHSDEMKEEGLRTAAQLGKLERAAQHHIPEKCEKFNDSFWRYYGKLAYADEVRREQGDKRSGSAPLLNNMSHIDDRLNAINARAVSDALEAAKINQIDVSEKNEMNN